VPTFEEVKAYLEQRGFSVLRFNVDTSTSEKAARAVGCSVGEIAKTMLFLVGNQPVVVIASGDKKVRGSLLKKTAGLRGKVRLPEPETVRRLLGYDPGGVCPFLLPRDIPVFIDSSLRRYSTIYPAAGTADTAVPMTVDDLLAITGGKEARVCE